MNFPDLNDVRTFAIAAESGTLSAAPKKIGSSRVSGESFFDAT